MNISHIEKMFFDFNILISDIITVKILNHNTIDGPIPMSRPLETHK